MTFDPETRLAVVVLCFTALLLALICLLANCVGDPMDDPACEPCPECIYPDNQ